MSRYRKRVSVKNVGTTFKTEALFHKNNSLYPARRRRGRTDRNNHTGTDHPPCPRSGGMDMKTCKCRGLSIGDYDIRPAPEDWQALRAYFCKKCGEISHAYSEKNVNSRSPREKASPLSAHGKANGQWIRRWATDDGIIETVEFVTYPRKVPVEQEEPLIFAVWQHLQEKMEIALSKQVDPWSNEELQKIKEAKNEARGIAEVLAILMAPFMGTADDVVRHAVKFYKDNSYEVPGLAAHLWNPLKNYDGSDVISFNPKTKPVARPKAKAAPKPKNTNQLAEGDIPKIKAGLEAGVMDEQGFADLFKVSLETLREAIRS